MWSRKERELLQDPLSLTWEEIQVQAKGEEHWVKQALKRAKKQCSELLEPEPSPLKELGLVDPSEQELFYTFLLERFARTDPKLKTAQEYDYLGKVIDPVRSEIIKSLSVPDSNAKAWIRKLDNAAQNIVFECRKGESLGDQCNSIARIATRFRSGLDELREGND